MPSMASHVSTYILVCEPCPVSLRDRKRCLTDSCSAAATSCATVKRTSSAGGRLPGGFAGIPNSGFAAAKITAATRVPALCSGKWGFRRLIWSSLSCLNITSSRLNHVSCNLGDALFRKQSVLLASDLFSTVHPVTLLHKYCSLPRACVVQ